MSFFNVECLISIILAVAVAAAFTATQRSQMGFSATTKPSGWQGSAKICTWQIVEPGARRSRLVEFRLPGHIWDASLIRTCTGDSTGFSSSALGFWVADHINRHGIVLHVYHQQTDTGRDPDPKANSQPRQSGRDAYLCAEYLWDSEYYVQAGSGLEVNDHAATMVKWSLDSGCSYSG